MRTTIRIDDELLRQVKQLAASRGKSLTMFIEDALREVLARQQKMEGKERIRLLTFSGQGLLPGVDLDDSATLLDLMETERDPG